MKILFFFVFSLLSTFASADSRGLVLDKTRVIFHESSRSASFTVSNKSTKNLWLLRSWIESYDGKKDTPFIITPPLYRLESDGNIQLRINRKGAVELPNDRESVFMINALSIPPNAEKNDDNKSSLEGGVLISVNTRIKMFYRPQSIDNKNINTAHENLVLRKGSPGFIVIENPSPYYITLTKIKVNGVAYKNNDVDLMVSPLGQKHLPVNGTARSVALSTINDFGGITPERIFSF